MSQFIPYGRQSISEDDIDAVVDVLRSDWLTQGPTIERFEAAVANYCGANYAVAVSSATAALHISCLALGLGQGDWLWTSPNTFVASANCGLYCGAKVDFVDIDPVTYNLSIDKLEKKLVWAEKNNCLPKIVVPVHFSGQSCEMHRIDILSKQYGFRVLEDASHAIGGSYKGEKVGCCSYSDMAVFSFHPVKILTTGEGGMVVTNCHSLYTSLVRLRTHGITRDPEQMQGKVPGAWYYQQIDLGFNYRITDIQAALGISQLRRLEEFVVRRRFLANRYQVLLEDLPVLLPKQHDDSISSWHLFVIQLRIDLLERSRAHIFESLRNLGIGVNVHYIPVHIQPYYQKMGFRKGDFSVAEEYYEYAISLPLFPGLSETNQNRVAATLKEVLQ